MRTETALRGCGSTRPWGARLQGGHVAAQAGSDEGADALLLGGLARPQRCQGRRQRVGGDHLLGLVVAQLREPRLTRPRAQPERLVLLPLADSLPPSV